MRTLLEIQSSPLAEASISRQLTAEFIQSWKLANPDGKVITRDLATTPIDPISAAWVDASYTPEPNRTPEQRSLLTLSDSLIAELETADEYILGVPMHNFSVPSTLKLWIDQISRVNKTFSYATGSPVGLLVGKKATIVTSSGGKFDAGTALASFNFVEPYLRHLFRFLGVADTTFLSASGVAAIKFGQIDRQTFLQPHIDSIRAQFQVA